MAVTNPAAGPHNPAPPTRKDTAMPENTPAAPVIPDLVAYRIGDNPSVYFLEVWGWTPSDHDLIAALAGEWGVPNADVELVTSA